MGSVKTELITNGTIYINGQNLLGTVESIESPAIKYKTKELEAVGVFGSRKVKVGLEAVELKIKRFSISAANINTHDPVSGKIVGTIQTKEGKNTVRTQAVIHFSGESFETVFGEFKSGEWSGHELSLQLPYMRMLVGDYEKFHIDIDNDIYKEDGKDMREWA